MDCPMQNAVKEDIRIDNTMKSANEATDPSNRC